MYLALPGWYNIDSAIVFTLLSTADTWWNTGGAHLIWPQHGRDKLSFHPSSQQVHYLRETIVRGAYRSIKFHSLRDASKHFWIPNFGQLFRTQIEEDWGHEVCWLVLRYHQNVLKDSIIIQLQNTLSYYCQPFHCPTSVQRLGLDFKVEYTNANKGIMPESHNIWVQYPESDRDSTWHRRVPSFPVLYFRWTASSEILHFQQCLTTRKSILTSSKRFVKTQKSILHRQAQE